MYGLFGCSYLAARVVLAAAVEGRGKKKKKRMASKAELDGKQASKQPSKQAASKQAASKQATGC